MSMTPEEILPQASDQPRRAGIFDHGFASYRTVQDADYASLLTSGLVILDTNVLLNLYRYHERTRSELVGVLAQLGDRLWIPHHVMGEFWRRRSTLLQDPKEVEQVVSDLDRYRDTYTDRVRSWVTRVGLPRGHAAELLDTVDTTFGVVTQTVREFGTDDSLKDADDTTRDPVISRLSHILEGRIGHPLETNLKRAKIEEARHRFKDSIPPGYKDAGKGDNFAGDYLIWVEILREATNRSLDVLFVTGDVKEDWWRIESGQAKGPRPELVAEMAATANVKLFMLRPASLLHHASKILRVRVSEDSVLDVKRVSDRNVITSDAHKAEGSLRLASNRVVSAVFHLEQLHPGSGTQQLLANASADLEAAITSGSTPVILEAAWPIIDLEDKFRASVQDFAVLPDLERTVWREIELLRNAAVQSWLDRAADAYIGHYMRNPRLDFRPELAPTVTSVRANPVIWDEDGIGQFEFRAVLLNGDTITTTRVVPLDFAEKQRSRAMIVEAQLRAKLSEAFGSSVSSNIRSVEDHSPALDAVARYPSSDLSVVFEIKYARSKNLRPIMADGLARVARGASTLQAIGAFLIVVPDDAADSVIANWTTRATTYASDFQTPPHILVVRFSEFAELDSRDMLEKLDLPSP